MPPTGAEIVEQLNASMESDSSTDSESEETEEVVSEDKTTQKAEDSSTKGSKEEKSQKTVQNVPYDRFKEKVDQVAKLTEKLETVLNNSESSTARENELRSKIEALEEEADILNRVRSLAENEKYRPLVEKLDAALKGIDEEVESGEKTEKQAEREVSRLFSEQRDELAEAFADQRADMLLENARMLSESILESLPGDYDETDKNQIAEILPDLVDWDAIEKEPGTMRDNIVEGYKLALVEYGEPRGALKARIHELETNKSEESVVDPAVSDEEFVKGILDDERMSKFKSDDDGNITEPEMSEDEFNDNFAQVLRRVFRQ